MSQETNNIFAENIYRLWDFVRGWCRGKHLFLRTMVVLNPVRIFQVQQSLAFPNVVISPSVLTFYHQFSPLTTQNIFVYQLNVTDCELKGENILWVFWLLDFYPCFNCHHFHRGLYRWQWKKEEVDTKSNKIVCCGNPNSDTPLTSKSD